LRLQLADLSAQRPALRRCLLAEEQEAAALAAHGAVLAGGLLQLRAGASRRLGDARICAALAALQALQAGDCA
jgi:hypothetical protein